MARFGRRHTTTGSAEAEVIDLRDEVVAPATASSPPRPVAGEFGRPTPCPACGHSGYLDGIDIKRRVMFQHCPGCGTRWDTSEAELFASH
jgi:hypothetical protein